MKPLRLLDSWPSGSYRDHTGDAWPCGESRDVEEDRATYLLDTFPEYFVVVETKAAAKTKAAPKAKAKKRKPKAG